MTREHGARRWTAIAESSAPLIIPCALAGLLFLRLLHAPFLTWDDDKNISLNPYYLYLGWWRLWIEPYFGVYVPVVSAIWAALFKLGAGSAVPFRLFNAAIHALNAFLVARLLSSWMARRGLSGSSVRIAVGIGVTVFALHPMQTAAVAWISGGRDLTATAFGLGAILVAQRDGRRQFALATLLFAIGLLCKPSIAAIPLALAAHDAMLERPRLGRTLRRMSLWTVLVVADAAGTKLMQSEMVQASVNLIQRPLIALDAAGFYVLKALWPASLSGDYGRSPAAVLAAPRLLAPTLSAIAIALVLLWLFRRQRDVVTWGWMWLLALLPVLGFVPFAFQRISSVADHYMYLPMVAVAGLAAVCARRASRSTQLGAFVLLAAVMSVATWRRMDAWRDSTTYFSDVLAKNPASYSALTNLAKAACEKGDLEWGLTLSRRSLALNPSESATLANQAYCLFHARRFADVTAMIPGLRGEDVTFSLEHNDAAASSLANTIAGSYFELGDSRRGLRFLCQAIAITPYNADLRRNLGDVITGDANFQCPPRVSWREFLSQ